MASVVRDVRPGLDVMHAADHERLQAEIETARDPRQALQFAGHAHARQRVGLRYRRPQHALVLARVWRWKFRPKLRVVLGTNRTVLTGISISAVQPSFRLLAAHHTPSSCD